MDEKVLKFEADFKKWFEENPEIAGKIKEELILACGAEDESNLINEQWDFNYCLAKVPIDELISFGTVCGKIDNRPFTSEVMDFFKSKGIEFVAVVMDRDLPEISSLAAPLDFDNEDAYEFSEMITSNGGSLRPDPSQVAGWSNFESE